MQKSAMCANDDQTFWPLTRKWSPLILDARASRGEVAAGVRLREPLAPDLLGAQDLRQVPLLLRVGPPRDDRRAGHPEADHAEVRGRLGSRELFEEDRLMTVRRAGPAELLRPGEPGVSRLTEAAAPVAVGVLEPAAASLLRGGGQVVRDELAHFLPERRLVGRVAEIHDSILTPYLTVKWPNMIGSCGGQ